VLDFAFYNIAVFEGVSLQAIVGAAGFSLAKTGSAVTSPHCSIFPPLQCRAVQFSQ